MDWNNLTDSLVLLSSGTIVLLFAMGKLFPSLLRSDGDTELKQRTLLVGCVIVFVGVVQLVRGLL
ncbi:MAG: hypothetical protein AAGD11_11015 [Planctomycetota bacterium]